MWNTISERHRKELLRFLLVRTAPVRAGVKPGELLRVRHCYRSRNSEGFQFCLRRNDILDILKLEHLELDSDNESSLILFFHREKLAEALCREENLRILLKCGYPCSTDPEVLLTHLKGRFAAERIPHEIGVFIGYPAKDVKGFIEKLPRTPVHRSDWAIFGDAGESLSRMDLYRQVVSFAASIIDGCEDLQSFFDCLNGAEKIYSATK